MVFEVPPLMATKSTPTKKSNNNKRSPSSNPSGAAPVAASEINPTAAGASSETEDSRKKRCSDRYDSSESSDSGVAVSCTDSSTASSDSSDPGSPYSPGSVEEANKATSSSDQHIIQSSTVSSSCKTDVPMVRVGVVGSSVVGAPAQTQALGNGKALPHPWTNWGGRVDALPKLVPTTNSAPLAAANGLKKLPLLVAPNKSQGVKKGKSVASPIAATAIKSSMAPHGSAPVSSTIAPAQSVGAQSQLINNSNGSTIKPQTKITGFFKTQMKSSQSSMVSGGQMAVMTATGALNVPPLIKKDLTNLVIRSKEFPKTAKKNNGNARKSTGEKKPRGSVAGAKNVSMPVQGNTIKDIIMKKPVNIAPRVDATLQMHQHTNPAMHMDQQSHLQSSPNTATLARIAQQPQLVLTAFRVTPEMIQQNGQQLHRMHTNGGQGNGASNTQNANGGAGGGSSNSGLTISGASPVDNKGNPVQFQYPLNGSFVSFANLLAQPQQMTATNGQGMDGNKQMNSHHQQQQQQLFLSQLGALGKPSNAQFILNGTLVKLANQGTTIEPCNGSNRLVTGTPVAGECGDLKSSPPTLISTAAMPAMLATSSSTKQTHNQQPQHQHHQSAPMFMSMGQNGQFILNTSQLPPLLTTTTTTTTQGGATITGIPQTMPSLQPISLSSFAEPHVQQQQQQNLQQLNNAANLLKAQANLLAKRRPIPPLAATSSPPELVLLQPIAKAMAAAAASASGKRAGEEKIRGGQGNNKQTKVATQPGLMPLPGADLKKTVSAAALAVPQKVLPLLEVQSKEQKIVSKVMTTTEVVRQTTMTATLLETTTTTMTTETSAKDQTLPKESKLNSFASESVQAFIIADSVSPIITPMMTVVPPSLTSPKSLVLEKLRLKSETTIRTLSSEERTEKHRLAISTDCLDVAKRQLGVLVDQHHLQLQECAKSPILSQPKTIRFPVRGGGGELRGKGQRKSGGYVSGNCYWEECNARFENSSKLLDHMQTHHVSGQSGPYKCLWEGCRVNGRESCSRRWLEGHVSSHGGSRTFKCIFEGCGQRFSSQLALQKHVNVHLSSSEKESQPNSNRKSCEGGAAVGKYMKRNGKKLRYRRQPWSARMFDFFDAGIMEGLEHRLGASSQVTASGMLQLKGRELARRMVKKGEMTTEVYVEWAPANIIADDWVCVTPGKVSEYIVSTCPLIKSIPIRQLCHSEQCALQKHLMRSYTMPLEVDTSLVAAAFAGPQVEMTPVVVESAPESSASVAMEQDSDSGKGTQRSESSAASPVSCSSKSEVRKLKRKSKSLSSESTDDSGLQTKTAKKHLKVPVKGNSTKPEKKVTPQGKQQEEEQQKEKKIKIKKQLAKGILSLQNKKKSQYLKTKRSDSQGIRHCPKSNRLVAGDRKKGAKREKC